MLHTKLLSFILIIFSTTLMAAEFPKTPDLAVTPGSLCHSPDQYRYPERIPYCKRDVSSDTKKDVFAEYRRLGFTLNIKNNRDDYKIDHFIPLCAGGSNDESNLWPQHKSVFELTDPLESVGCEKLKDGKIKQAKLIEMIKAAKTNLAQVPNTLKFLENL